MARNVGVPLFPLKNCKDSRVSILIIYLMGLEKMSNGPVILRRPLYMWQDQPSLKIFRKIFHMFLAQESFFFLKTNVAAYGKSKPSQAMLK